MKHNSLKHIVLIVISLIIIGIVFIVAEYRNNKTDKLVYTSSNLSVENKEVIDDKLIDSDSDNDGLKDWEEILLGTDINNRDSDGDGTDDGIEAKSGRNPLVKGPNDKEDIKTLQTKSSTENLTNTDRLARDFFAKYMELKQLGLAGNEQDQRELAIETLKNRLANDELKEYTLKDIKIAKDNTVDAIRKYGNEIGNIFKRNIVKDSRNEVTIAKDAIENEDFEILKELNPIISSYKTMISELISINVPEQMASSHLSLINSLNKLLFSAESLAKVGVDPVIGLQGISIYLDGAKSLNITFNDLKNRFNNNNIQYTSEEGGNFFIPQ